MTLVESKSTPVDGSVTFVERKSTPVEGDVTFVENKSTPVEGAPTFVERKSTPVEGNVTTDEGNVTIDESTCLAGPGGRSETHISQLVMSWQPAAVPGYWRRLDCEGHPRTTSPKPQPALVRTRGHAGRWAPAVQHITRPGV